MRNLVVAAFLGALLPHLTGCGGGGSGSGVTAGSSTLRVAITDRNSDDFASLVISIREVRVVPAGSEGQATGFQGLPVITTTPLSLDILSLGVGKSILQKVLGEAAIPPGSYSQVRLVLASNPPSGDPVNYITLKSAPEEKIALKTPSGQESGLKVVGRFDVKAGTANAILLDFDPNTAVVARGNGDYNLKPTGIRIVQLADAAYADFGSAVGDIVAFSRWSSAILSVVPQGGEPPVASGTVFGAYTSGAWRGSYSAFVPGGSYRLFIRASGFSVYSSPVTAIASGATVSLPPFLLEPAP